MSKQAINEDRVFYLLLPEAETKLQKLNKIIQKSLFYIISAVFSSMLGNALIGSATFLDSILYPLCGVPSPALGWSIFRSYRQQQPPLIIRFFALILFIVSGSALGTVMFDDLDSTIDVCRSSGLGATIEAVTLSMFNFCMEKYKKDKLLKIEGKYESVLGRP